MTDQTRRRRTLLIAGAVLTVGLIGGGAVAVGTQLTSEITHNTEASTPRPDAVGLTPPPGMRYVGRNGLAVAIPTTYRMDGKVCKGGLVGWQVPADYAGVMCPPTVSVHGVVSIRSYDDQASFFTPYASARSIGANRVAVYGPEDSCAHTDGLCPLPREWKGALLSRALDVIIVFTSRDRAEVSKILASAFALPDGIVAIPADAGPSALQALGLTVRHVIRSGDSLPRDALGVFPIPGSVVSASSVVRLVTGPAAWPNSSCEGLWIDITTPTRTIPIAAADSGPPITLHSGDILRLDAAGRCADAVRFNSDDGRTLAPRFKDELSANRAGTTHVTVWLAKCFVPNCRGGYDELTRLPIRVLP